MPSCAIFGCGNFNRKTKGTDIRYFRFPKNDFSKQWVIACQRQDKINLKNACVCSLHFEKDCFEDISVRQQLSTYTGKNFRNLKYDAVPTLNLPLKRKCALDSEMKDQIKRRRLIAENMFENTITIVSSSSSETDIKIETSEISVEIDPIISEKQEKILQLEERVAELEKENMRLLKENSKIKMELVNTKNEMKTFLSQGEIKTEYWT